MGSINDELSRLQKNARNKLYRLRKKGISNAQLDSIAVPVKSWGEVQRMNAVQKRVYIDELKAFNSRKNVIKTKGTSDEYLIQGGSNIALPAPDIWRFRLAEARRNVGRAFARQGVATNFDRAIESMSSEQFSGIRPYIRDIDADNRLLLYGDGRFNDLISRTRNTPFTSLENLEKATQLVSGEGEGVYRRSREKYEGYQKSIINRLNEEGLLTDDMSTKLESLTAEQLDFLYYNTDFDTYASMFRYEDDYKRGYQSEDESVKVSAIDALNRMINAVSNYNYYDATLD